MPEIKCCGQIADVYHDVKTADGSPAKYGIACKVCDNKFASDDLAETEKEFLKNAKPAPKPEPKKETKPASKTVNKGNNVNNDNQVAVVAKNKVAVLNMLENKDQLMRIVSPIVDRTNGNVERLIRNTYRYIENKKNFDRLWSTEEGTASLIRETEEALMMGLELGKAGDIVPYGDDCSFIPDVDGVIFALTDGKSAPFKWVEIDVEYEGDEVESGRKTGNFFVNFIKMGDDRNKATAVYVYGFHNHTGLIKGEKYDAKRLLEKAFEHSEPYKNYRKKMNAFEFAKKNGNTELDANGREFFKYYTIKDSSNDKYFEQSVEEFKRQEAAGTLKGSGNKQYAEQELPKKGGGTWTKKIYRYEVEGGQEEQIIYPDDLKNPYAGPDQPEMLRKTAGKSFLNKYLKTRGSEAAREEIRTSEEARDQALKMGRDQVDTVDGDFE
jgi:hypothetical protein